MPSVPGQKLDLTTAALIGGGAVLIAMALVAGYILLVPSWPAPDEPTPLVPPLAAARPSAALPADRVAASLSVDAGTGGAAAALAGDHVDVLGYFSRQVTGTEGLTRVLLRDVPVLTVDRSADTVALTLAVTQDSALLLQELQALGGRPFVTLLSGSSPSAPGELSASFSDSDLGRRLTVAR